MKNKISKNNLRKTLLSGFLWSAMAVPAFSQYPKIPDSIKLRPNKDLLEGKRFSEALWKKALPTVYADTLKGKPYIPGAAKPEDLPQAKIPAFPGAEGGGAFSFGGRGGKIYVVKTLADSGPGSFREACGQGGARIVIFNVAGIIQLKSPVFINAPYITISGRTAPGDGVCIAGESVWINTHDVVISYMRFRRGAMDVTRRDDGLGGNPIGNVMIDHVSASWGLDENMSIYRHMYKKAGEKEAKLATVNVTIQNSIFSEGLDTYNHAFGSTIGGYNSTFMRNLWACNVARNPSVGMDGSFNMVNNVVFNWWNRSVDGGGSSSEFNIINNYFKPGPITPKNEPIAYRILKPESSKDADGVRRWGKAYVNGNYVDGFPVVSADNWKGGVQMEDTLNTLEDIRVSNPFKMAKLNVMLAPEAYQYVLANAGATQPKRDPVDERIVRQVATGKIEYTNAPDAVVKTPFITRRLAEDSYKQGIITDPLQVGGYPNYKGTPYKDSDDDGMPDAWEIKYGLNPKNAADALGDINKDGYTNIEKFIYNIDPKGKTDWSLLSNTINVHAAKTSQIVSTLNLSDTTKAQQVWKIINAHYQQIAAIHQEKLTAIDAVKELKDTSKAAADKAISKAWEVARTKLTALHAPYLSALATLLSPAEVITVKDGMTDNGLQNEMDRFTAMFPTMKEDEKKQVLDHLLEARENAMDAVESRERHQWFAKYRGRANIYLSKQGYDLKEATARLKAKQKTTVEN